MPGASKDYERKTKYLNFKSVKKLLNVLFLLYYFNCTHAIKINREKIIVYCVAVDEMTPLSQCFFLQIKQLRFLFLKYICASVIRGYMYTVIH